MLLNILRGKSPRHIVDVSTRSSSPSEDPSVIVGSNNVVLYSLPCFNFETKKFGFAQLSLKKTKNSFSVIMRADILPNVAIEEKIEHVIPIPQMCALILPRCRTAVDFTRQADMFFNMLNMRRISCRWSETASHSMIYSNFETGIKPIQLEKEKAFSHWHKFREAHRLDSQNDKENCTNLEKSIDCEAVESQCLVIDPKKESAVVEDEQAKGYRDLKEKDSLNILHTYLHGKFKNCSKAKREKYHKYLDISHHKSMIPSEAMMHSSWRQLHFFNITQYDKEELELWTRKKCGVVAQVDYQSTHSNCLSVRKGQSLIVLCLLGCGWSLCYNEEGVIGYIPTLVVPDSFHISRDMAAFSRHVTTIIRPFSSESFKANIGEAVVILSYGEPWILVRKYEQPYCMGYVSRNCFFDF